MFAGAFFGRAYFGAPYFHAGAGGAPAAGREFWGDAYFGASYFGNRYFGTGGEAVPEPPAPEAGGRAWPIKDKEQRRESAGIAVPPPIGRPRRKRVDAATVEPAPIDGAQPPRSIEPVRIVAPARQEQPALRTPDTGAPLDGKVLEADLARARLAAKAVAQAEAAKQAEDAIEAARVQAAAVDAENARRRALLVALAMALEV